MTFAVCNLLVLLWSIFYPWIYVITCWPIKRYHLFEGRCNQLLPLNWFLFVFWLKYAANTDHYINCFFYVEYVLNEVVMSPDDEMYDDVDMIYLNSTKCVPSPSTSTPSLIINPWYIWVFWVIWLCVWWWHPVLDGCMLFSDDLSLTLLSPYGKCKSFVPSDILSIWWFICFVILSVW